MKKYPILFLCLVLTLSFGNAQEAASGRPNIIFIMVDDLGYADLGCYGQRVIQTPNIDQLAAEGTRYTQCYSGSTVCAPSRSVLMTGEHTGHTTVRGNSGLGGVVGLGGVPGRVPFERNDTTLAEVLKDQGYHTGMIGKWGLGEPGTTGVPSRQGFDYFYGYLNQRLAHSYFPDSVWENSTPVYFPANEGGRQADYIEDHFVEKALQYLDDHHQEPFFLYLPLTLPHDRYEIPDQGRFRDSLHWLPDERIYAAMVERMDRDVGLVMEKLTKLGIDENTVVFFCSDNGAAQRWEGRFDSSGSLRGRKRDMYEGGIRVPMIVRYPGVVAPGRVSDYPWYFADVLPSICALTGARAPKSVDGIDVWTPVIAAEVEEAPKLRPFYWEFHERGYQQAIRYGDFKAIRLGLQLPWELYNLREDPTESTNIASDRPEMTARLAAKAIAEHEVSHYWPVVRDGRKRRVFIIGDSTVKNEGLSTGEWGWGDLLSIYLDTSLLEVVNRARGGRSSKTYWNEGLWRRVLADMQEGDFVLMQFGHNDGGPVHTGKERGSLQGIGPETLIGTSAATGQPDTVHTYGWYIRQYIRDTEARGALPIVLSMVPRNRWVEGKIERVDETYGRWAREVAAEEQAYFVDLNNLVAEQYERIGKELLTELFFGKDHTHTTAMGADLNARSVIKGLHQVHCILGRFAYDRP